MWDELFAGQNRDADIENGRMDMGGRGHEPGG